MTCRVVVFEGKRHISVREEPIPEPGVGEVLVRTAVSAISAGTELLVYREQFPEKLPVDASIEGLKKAFSYPLRYGYAAVGQVAACGDQVDPSWEGRTVFAFHHHASYFVISPADLIPVPEGFTAEQAAFYPNTETAVTLVQDGAPLLGERVMVIGQGVVGLLTIGLLARFPLAELSAVEQIAKRRKLAMEMGSGRVLSANEIADNGDLHGSIDLTFEVSGNPIALDTAIMVTRFSGRVVIGSWYGRKRTPLNLGGHFHRSRMRLISSQVSSIAPELRGRWDRSRRTEAVWQVLPALAPERLITHRFPIQAAAEAYRLLNQHPEEAVQVLLTYDDEP